MIINYWWSFFFMKIYIFISVGECVENVCEIFKFYIIDEINVYDVGYIIMWNIFFNFSFNVVIVM